MNLAEYFQARTPQIADGVVDIEDAEAVAQKHKKYLLLLMLLSDFGKESKSILETSVATEVGESYTKLLAGLPKQFRTAAAITAEQYQQYASAAVRNPLLRLQDVIARIQALASTLRGGRNSLLRKLIGAKQKEPLTDSAARQKLRDKIIVVRGSDGIDRSYPPKHYAELLEDGATGAAQAETAKAMSENIGSDLVQMSAPTGRDWCDLYAGGIYSVSGTDPRVYPLSIVPGGGKGKLHPQCVHTFKPVPADFYTDKELRAKSHLPLEFVELGSGGKATASDFTKVWLQKSPKEWGL